MPHVSHRPNPVLVAGFVLCGASLTAAQADTAIAQSPQVETLVPGLFCAAEERNQRAAPETIAGFVYEPVNPVAMVAEGQVVPAMIGLGFGVRFTLADAEDAALDYTVTHPPMPPGMVTVQRWGSTLTGGNVGTVFFQFDVPEELQPGDWSFAATRDGAPVFRVGFTVRPASELPALVGLCQGGSLLSLSQRSRAAAG
ncbi:DUF3859 domain-containing protein [Pararhodobacter sp.]|uniref:DUF3859 domain-containing protein n=1 Tax=Pararhodobacter sp. TaxID=2127056 RepID=UPI002AFEC13C|nr:DUF3859 domain-containing protein [Pararhodobacter sp.]